MPTLTFHGHSCFVLEHDGKRVIIDPFLSGNPKADIPAAKQEEAARAAGFDGAKAIGPYLRTLIGLHHDTLAVAIK